MNVKRYLYSAIVAIFVAFLISGCALFTGYGKLMVQRGPEKVTIQKLQENWRDYNVYYAGYHGKLSTAHPSAVMFDPKNDDRTLVGPKWTKVEDEETLSDLVSSILSHKATYPPWVWRILGPDDQSFGYLFTAWSHVPLKVIDDKTMRISNLPRPPYLLEQVSGSIYSIY